MLVGVPVRPDVMNRWSNAWCSDAGWRQAFRPKMGARRRLHPAPHPHSVLEGAQVVFAQEGVEALDPNVAHAMRNPGLTDPRSIKAFGHIGDVRADAQPLPHERPVVRQARPHALGQVAGWVNRAVQQRNPVP